LDYQFGSGDEPQTVVHHDTLSRYIQSSLADSTTIEIDPATDATAFTNGIDNTTDEYRIGLVARRGSGGRNLSFELPRIVNAAMGAETQMTPARQLSHAMADAYGVRAFWGLEIGSLGPIAGTKWASAAGAGSHLALFLPGDVLGSMESAMKGPPAAYSNLAASYGGITAIAHPFGVSGLVPTKSDEAQFADAEELGSYLVANGGWGASLIEVGLVRRGEVSLRTHMYLHDYLWASGVRLCGIGVSDSHGGHVLKDPPLDNVEANNFVTWIGGVDAGSSGAEFIAQMKACNLSFGNPYYVRGGMWISAEPDSVAYRVAFDVDGVTPSAQFYLTEVGIDSSGTGHAPMYYKIGELTARTGGTQVGRCTPVFIRLEAWSAGRPIAFSNVVLLPGVARLCVSGARQN
jgi:hypothetical protein